MWCDDDDTTTAVFAQYDTELILQIPVTLPLKYTTRFRVRVGIAIEIHTYSVPSNYLRNVYSPGNRIRSSTPGG